MGIGLHVTPHTTRPGRVRTSAFAFATDLLDEGVTTVLDNLQGRAGLGGISPAFVYHASRDLFPHNPRRRVRVTNRGEFYFQPDLSLYAGLRIQPRVSAMAREHDILADTCRTAVGRGLDVHAWTVFLHADRPGEYSDCVSLNAFGDPDTAILCPANPDVRAYVRALIADVSRYEVTSIIAEALHFHELEHGYHHERNFLELSERARFLLGLCFCPHCLGAARRVGVSVEAVQEVVRAELAREFDAMPIARDEPELTRGCLLEMMDGEIGAFLDARAQTVTSLVAEAAEVAFDRHRRLTFMETAGARKGYPAGKPTGLSSAEGTWRVGVDLRSMRTAVPEIEVLGYSADAERLKSDLAAYRELLGDCPMAIGLRPSWPDSSTTDNLVAKLRIAQKVAAVRVDFYNYGLARLSSLDLIGAALDETGSSPYAPG